MTCSLDCCHRPALRSVRAPAIGVPLLVRSFKRLKSRAPAGILPHGRRYFGCAIAGVISSFNLSVCRMTVTGSRTSACAPVSCLCNSSIPAIG